MTSSPRSGAATRPFRAVAAAFCLLALTLSTGGPARGQSDASLVANGRVTYRVYCASCHGSGGEGDGALAEYLTIKPTDLTRIGLGSDGKFPRDEVYKKIDGREAVRGHSRSEMPVWGDALKESLQPTWKEMTSEERVGQKIRELVDFLQTIQVK